MARENDGREHFSTLKNISTTPLHYKHFRDNPRPDTDSFLIGRGVHSLVLENKEPAIFDGRRAGAEYKAAVLANGGDKLLSSTQGALARAMADSVSHSRLAMEILSRAPRRETKLIWERNGRKCAGRDDADDATKTTLPTVLVELKTAKSAHPFRFMKEAEFYRYPEQMSWYAEALGIKYEAEFTQWPDCYIIVVENNGPVLPVSVHRVSPLRLNKAHNDVNDWLEKVARCERERYWPGWDSAVNNIECEVPVCEDGDFDEGVDA